MRTYLEKQRIKHDALTKLGEGYFFIDFSPFLSYLSSECVLISDALPAPLEGYEAVANYLYSISGSIENRKTVKDTVVALKDEPRLMKNAATAPDGGFAELIRSTYRIGDIRLSISFERGDLGRCCGMVDIILDDDERVTKIIVDHSHTYTYIDSHSNFDFFPQNDYPEVRMDTIKEFDNRIYFNSEYIEELDVFLQSAKEYVMEYIEGFVTMPGWRKALGLWLDFVSSETYDDAFERLAGIDYEKGTIKNSDIAKQVSTIGKKIWDDRKYTKVFVESLIEWTERYKNYSLIIITDLI